MRKTIISGLALLALCGSAQAFDCKKQTVPAVAVVCSDPDLVKLTEERQRAYEAAKARAKGKARRDLVEEERHWIAEYPKACGVASKGKAPATIDKQVQECFRHAGEERMTYLREYAKPEAAAAVPKPAAPTAPAPNPTSAPPAPPGAPATAAAPAPTVAMPAPLPQPAAAASAAMPPPRPAPPSPATPPAPAAAEKAVAHPAAHGSGYHLKFTFACQSPGKLQQVLHALEQNDYAYPLNQTDCLPVPEGREATLLSVDGRIAKIRLCSTDAGCTDVFADAASVLSPAGQPLAK